MLIIKKPIFFSERSCASAAAGIQPAASSTSCTTTANTGSAGAAPAASRLRPLQDRDRGRRPGRRETEHHPDRHPDHGRTPSHHCTTAATAAGGAADPIAAAADGNHDDGDAGVDKQTLCPALLPDPRLLERRRKALQDKHLRKCYGPSRLDH